MKCSMLLNTERQITCDTSYMWKSFFFKGTNEFFLQNRSRVTGMQKQTYGYQQMRWEGINWEIGSDIYILLYTRACPAGSVVKNWPVNAGETGSIPGLGRSHIPWSNQVFEPQLLILCSKVQEPKLLSPQTTTTEAQMLQSLRSKKEATAVRSPCIATRE